ncbi:hypothetical protein [uncultured Croceitalea sp.]|uniref:hypothetical protein n=1 Tax=uncultured Croceitalea sp. TaxID=1798908 RepID=UPI00374ED4BB
MLELQPEYLNKIANQLIIINSLLGGFSIAVMANLLITKSEGNIGAWLLKVSILAAAFFLITVFAMTKIVMMTTEGYPIDFETSELTFPKIVGFASFVLGIVSLCMLLGLSGWNKSRATGIFSTSVGVVTLVLILLNL